jgi:uncharacterized membrane protein
LPYILIVVGFFLIALAIAAFVVGPSGRGDEVSIPIGIYLVYKGIKMITEKNR